MVPSVLVQTFSSALVKQNGRGHDTILQKISRILMLISCPSLAHMLPFDASKCMPCVVFSDDYS